MLYHKKVTPEDAKHLIDYFHANEVDFILSPTLPYTEAGIYSRIWNAEFMVIC